MIQGLVYTVYIFYPDNTKSQINRVRYVDPVRDMKLIMNPFLLKDHILMETKIHHWKINEPGVKSFCAFTSDLYKTPKP